MIRKILYTFFALCSFISLNAQVQDSILMKSSFNEDAALVAMTGVIIPLAIVGAAISFVPPSLGIMTVDGTSYGTIRFETGIGVGTRRGSGVFSDTRFLIGYTHVMRQSIRDIVGFSMTKDIKGEFLDKRSIMLYGFNPKLGLITNFPETGYSLGASVWIMTPNLPFIGLFPLHTIGITYEYNKYLKGISFQMVSVGVSSALTFE
jgi:hypothetical protein